MSYQNAAFSRDGKGLYVTLDAGSEFQRLASMDLATKKTEFLTPDTADVDDFDLSEDGARIAYVTNEKGVSVVRLLDTATRRELPGPKLPLGDVGGLSWHKDGGAIAFTMGTARSNADAYSWDSKTGKLDRWTTSELGGLNPETFAEAELVTWKSFDGREISGFLYKPNPQKFPGKRPVVIDIHGGPEGQSSAGFLGRDNYFPNELGVAMLFPNVRGSTGYGKTFSKLDNGMLREGTYKDIGALLDWIATRPDLDASRDHGPGRELRRAHDARRGVPLQRPDPLRDRRRGPLELRDLPAEHVGLPPRPPARRVRRRARPQDARVPREDRAAQQCRKDPQAPLHHPGRKRPARAALGVRADASEDPHASAPRSGT